MSSKFYNHVNMYMIAYINLTTLAIVEFVTFQQANLTVYTVLKKLDDT